MGESVDHLDGLESPQSNVELGQRDKIRAPGRF